MKVLETKISGLKVLEPEVWEDSRGYFFESYSKIKFDTHSGDTNFVQDNEARSNKGVIRGLHYQLGAAAQAKLVRVVKGKVLDVAVDIREGSETYGQWYGIILSSDNKKQLFVPRGMAHGYLVLEDETIFTYKCDNFYSKENEGGVRFDDPILNIDWQIGDTKLIQSAKDKALPFFGDHLKFHL